MLKFFEEFPYCIFDAMLTWGILMQGWQRYIHYLYYSSCYCAGSLQDIQNDSNIKNVRYFVIDRVGVVINSLPGRKHGYF